MRLLILSIVLSLGLGVAAVQNGFFRSGKTYTYSFKSDAFLPLQGIDTIMDYILKVTVIGPNRILITGEDFKIFDKNGNIPDIGLSEKIRTYLESPMEVTLTPSGSLQSMYIEPNTPEWAVNIKRTQVSHLLVLTTRSTTGRGRVNTVRGEEANTYTAQEESVLGDCESKYNVQELQQDNQNLQRSFDPSSSEEQLPSSEDSMWRDVKNYFSSHESSSEETLTEGYYSSYSEQGSELNHFGGNFRQFCDEGDTLYEFTKSIEVRKCAGVSKLGTRGVATSRYVACGRDRKELTILEISHKLEEVPSPLFLQISLLEVVPTNVQPRSFSTSPKEIKDFTYKYFALEDKFKIEVSLSSDENDNETFKHHDRISFYRSCLERNGLPTEKLVPRDANSEWYNHLNHQWNLRKEVVYPLAYFLPTNPQDVAHAVQCGLKTNVHVIPNSGGHSYEAIGWGTNETLVIDFRNMKNIAIEGSGKNAIGKIEPGAMVGPVNAYLWENGGYAMPMGNCLTVGIGGHAIGGGIGYFSTLYGLTLDNVVEVEAVDGHGNLVVASKDQNPDLFWALRGSGPGYIGIVTSVKVKLFEASKIKITRVSLQYQIKHFAKVWMAFQEFQNWLKENEPYTFLSFMLGSDTYNASFPALDPGMTVSVVHIQDPNIQPNGNEPILESVHSIFPQPAQILESFPNYIQFVAMTGYAPVLLPSVRTGKVMEISRIDDPVLHNRHTTEFTDLPSEEELIRYLKMMSKAISAPRYFKAKTFFIRKQFTLEEMNRVQEVIDRIPQNNIWLLVNSEMGNIHRVGKRETAYVHRDALLDFSIHYEGSPDPNEVKTGMEYLEKLWDTIQFMDGGETYQNYPDFDVEDHLDRNYKQNLPRLIQQKRKWDPRNYFRSPISLPIRQRQ